MILHMIVRDEALVIARCLDSVMPHVRAAVVHDTGSVDETREIITARPEEIWLGRKDWIDFGANRTLVLADARALADDGEYLITIDADEELVVDDVHAFDSLTADAYEIEVRYSGLTFTRHLVTRAAFPWRYDGVVHEDIALPVDYEGPAPRLGGVLRGVHVVSHRDGARQRAGDKFRRDVDLLRPALGRDPTNPRLTFYLAQSLRDSGEYAEAAAWYERRVSMSVGDEESWCAQYARAQCLQFSGAAPSLVIEAYLAAYNARPTRAEPLAALEEYLRSCNAAPAAQLFADARARMPRTTDRMFVHEAAYALPPLPLRVGFLTVARKGDPLQYTITSAVTSDARVTCEMISVYSEDRMIAPPGVHTPQHDTAYDHPNPQARALIDLSTAWDGDVVLCEDDVLFARDWASTVVSALDILTRAIDAPIVLCGHHMHGSVDLFEPLAPLRVGRYALYRQSPRSWPNGSQMLAMRASTARAYAASLPSDPIRVDGARKEWGFDVRLYQWCAAGNAMLVFVDPCLCMHMHTIASTWWPDRDPRIGQTKRFLPYWR